MQDLSPGMRMEQGLGLDALGHKRGLHPHSPDIGHVSVSELSPCKGSVDVETVTGLKTDSLETLVKEADDLRGV